MLLYHNRKRGHPESRFSFLPQTLISTVIGLSTPAQFIPPAAEDRHLPRPLSARTLRSCRYPRWHSSPWLSTTLRAPLRPSHHSPEVLQGLGYFALGVVAAPELQTQREAAAHLVVLAQDGLERQLAVAGIRSDFLS